jgi:hypothetical protein
VDGGERSGRELVLEHSGVERYTDHFGMFRGWAIRDMFALDVW